MHVDKISDIIVLLKYYCAYTEGELENLSNTDNIDGAVRCSTHYCALHISPNIDSRNYRPSHGSGGQCWVYITSLHNYRDVGQNNNAHWTGLILRSALSR